jgi:CRISPR-associated protein Csm1
VELEDKVRVSAWLHDIGKLIQRSGRRAYHDELSAEFVDFLDPDIKDAIAAHHHERRGKDLNELSQTAREILEILLLADRWDAQQREKDEDTSGTPLTTPLSVYFDENLYFPVAKYSFPYDTFKPEKRKPQLEYDQTAKYLDIIKEILNLNISEKTKIYALNALLREFTFFVPSYTQTTCKISLYHHLRTTAALAHAIYRYKKAFGHCPDENEDAFLLLGGDLSGIQDFIYRIKVGGKKGEGKQFGKRLRGRSLLIQMLQYLLVCYILDELELGIESVVYASGGNFAILADNTKQTVEKIEEIRHRISLIFRRHLDPLYISIACAPFAGKALKNFGIVLAEKIWPEIEKTKFTRDNTELKEIFKERYEGFLCRYCNSISEQDECAICQIARGIGERYNATDDFVLCYTRRKLDNAPGIYFEEIGRGVYLIPPHEYIPGEGDIPKLLGKPENREECFEWFRKCTADGIPCSYDYRLLSEGKSFDELADGHASQPTYLAYLLMDADSLGEKVKSVGQLSHYSELSEQLDLFFTRGVHHALQKLGQNVERIYLVYSGGDDLFMVGRWDAIFACVKEIQKEFTEFFGNGLTISAGISLHKHKFPLYRASECVRRMESIAKKSNKNGVCVFNEKMSWDAFASAIQIGNEYAKSPLSDSLLYNLLSILQDEELAKHPARRNATIVYIVGKHVAGLKDPRKQEALHELKRKLCEATPGNVHVMKFMLACSLLTRRLEKQRGEKNG